MCGPKTREEGGYQGVDPRQVRGISLGNSKNVPRGTIPQPVPTSTVPPPFFPPEPVEQPVVPLLPKPELQPIAPPDPSGLDTDFILNQEMGGKAYYNKKLTGPTWPAVHSGVTIGAGYDLGYNTPDQIRQDWKGYLPDDQIERLTKYAGVTGQKAERLARDVSDIHVDYDTAAKQFRERTLPRYMKETQGAFNNLDSLDPKQQTALVSLVFNRGPAVTGKNREEMAAIQKALSEGKKDVVPDLIRKMKRLWPGTQGLLDRRDAEANLFSSAFDPTQPVA